MQACAFKANPSSSDTQRGAESSRGLMLVSGVWAGNWGLEVYKTLSSLNLEKSQLHILLQLSLPGGTPEATRYPKAFSAASSVFM